MCGAGLDLVHEAVPEGALQVGSGDAHGEKYKYFHRGGKDDEELGNYLAVNEKVVNTAGKLS